MSDANRQSNATIDSAPFLRALDPTAVITDGLEQYAVEGIAPGIALRPDREADVAAALRTADTLGLAMVIHGGRTAMQIGNPLARYDVALDTTALHHLLAHEPDDLTVAVQTGMRIGALQRTLAKSGQFIPLDPPRADTATVGGVIALGRGGSRRATYGSVRDWLIGCTLIRADGTRVKGGGQVVKNVSGYDLPKLFSGSLGTLGCIVEATLKLRPLPPVDTSEFLPASGFAGALAQARILAMHVPGLHAVVAVDAATAQRLNLPGEGVLIRAAGTGAAVAATLEVVRELSVPPLTPEEDTALWQRVANLEGTPLDPTLTLIRIGVPPAALEAATAALHVTAPSARRWAYADSGLLLAAIPAYERLPAGGLPLAITQLRATLREMGGSLVVDIATRTLKSSIDVWGDPAGGIAIMRRIKAAFDPDARLAPGRFVGGI